MKQGHPLTALGHAIEAADIAVILRVPQLGWDPGSLAPHAEHTTLQICDEVSDITGTVMDQILPNDTIVTMSNGSFGGLRTQLLNRLRNRAEA
jgi:UDP-N-acetylmuramate-alanine ligase